MKKAVNNTLNNSNPIHIDQPLLSVRAAAQYLSVSRAQLYNLMGQGKIPYTRVGSARRIRPQDLQTFIQSNMVGAAG